MRASCRHPPPAARQVSFGREYDDYLVLYRDGSVKWHGVPPKLSAKLKGLTHSSPAIANVSMGPDGEWCAVAMRAGAQVSCPPAKECSSSSLCRLLIV